VKRALEGAIRRHLRHSAAKESKHDPGYDAAVIARATSSCRFLGDAKIP